uniref:Fibronectin n=1 Tax=Petromyzon marinus TaxID=7757 RepID=S4RC14_PETMA
GCNVNGKMYSVAERWERVYLGRMLTCTCFGGDRGWTCEGKPEPESCFDQYTGGRYRAGETWERPKGGLVWDCTCLGASVSRISCTTASRCHEGGSSYKIGDKWRRVHESGSYMMDCVCLGNGKGEWICNPVSGSQERCYDNTLGSAHLVGDTWERPYQGWMVVDCTCLGEGQGRIACTSRNRCNDQETRRSYKVGETWSRADARGQPLRCLCIGNGNGEWKCDRQTSSVTATVSRSSRRWFVGGVRPPPPPLSLSVGTVYRPTVQCEADGGALFSSGERWVKSQDGGGQLLCTCLPSGVNCQTIGPPIKTHGGNSNGAPGVSPFTHKGRGHTTCTAKGRDNGKLWGSTTANYPQNKKFSLGSQKKGTTVTLVTTRGGNSNGALCHFPFVFGGREHVACTSEGRADGMKWCSTTANFDTDQRYGFCPMAAHEDVCTADGVQHRVGDQWDRPHELGQAMRCTCIGGGRGDWTCVPYTKILDQCVIDGRTYNVNQTFLKRHDEGHMMNCTCLGQGRGRWKCDAMDQCQDTDSRQFYQIGETWVRLVEGSPYMCICLGKGIGEWSCNPQTNLNEVKTPIQVFISDASNQASSHPRIEWANTQQLPHVTGYLLRWRQKNSRLSWREVSVPARLNSYTITGLKPGLTYEGQLITLLVSGLREVTRFEFTTSLVTHHFGGTVPPVLSGASETMTEITSSSFLVSWVSTSSSVSGFRVEYELSEDGAVTHRLGRRSDLPNTANSVSLENLLPGRRYHVKVYEVTDGQDDSLILITTQTTAPDAPQQYEVTEATDTSLVIRWIAPKAPIRGYRIVFTPVEEGSRPELASTELTLPSESTSVTLSGLAPGVTYNITLTAVGETQDSEPVFIQQSTLPGTGQHRELILAPPTDLQFVAVTETKIVLMWNRPVAPDDAMMGFRIVVTPLGRAQEAFRVPFTEHTFADMDGLQPGVTYRFEVYAVYHQGGQESQPLVREQTTPGAPVVDAPSDMRFVEITETSVAINWTAPQAALDSYHLSYGPTRPGAGRPKSLAVSPEARHHTERGLRPATEYTITLRSVKNGQRSVPLSAIFTTRPLPGSLPEIITEITETSLTFRWKPTASVSVLFKLFIPSLSSMVPRTETSESGSILIDGLTPGEQYIVTVSILWDGRQIARPATKTITTLLMPPQDVQVDFNSPSGVLTISWQRVAVPELTGYRVRGVPLRGQRGNSLDELLRPDQTSFVLDGLTPGVEYNITVATVKGVLESKPFSTTLTTVTPRPSDLSFTDVSDTSLVLRWTPLSVPGITGYRVTVSLPGDSSPLLEDTVGPRTGVYAVEGLRPGVVYDIGVSTLSEDGESEPARRSQTTAVPPPTDLRFTQVELDSFRVSWSAPPISTTESFLIRYSPLRHEDLLSEVSTTPDELEVILTGLLPGTVYGVSVHTVIRGHESVGLSGTQGTEIDAPTDMEFLDVTDSTFTVYWTPSNAPVSGYRVAYGPQLLGHVAEDSVPPERTSIVLASLQAGTEYTVSVYAIGRDVHRESEPLVGSQATNSNGPTDLVITRTSPTTFSVSWTPPPISVRYYRLRGTHGGGGARAVTADHGVPVSRSEFAIFEKYLPPRPSPMNLFVFATFDRGASTARTAPAPGTEVDTPSGLEVMEVTDRTIRIRWAPSKAPINGYRVTSIPKTGRGTQDTRELPSGRTDVTIDGLLPTLEYAVNVYALSDHGESLPASKNVVTGIDAPKGLTFTDVDVDSMSISWDSPEGTVTGYRVLYESLDDGVPQTLSPAPDGDADTAVISQLQPGSDYKVSVTALHHGTESLPLMGTQATAIPPPTALKLVQATSTSLSIQWQPPSAEVSGFRVVVTPREKSGPSRDHMVPADVNSFTLPSLMVATQYNVFVYALKNGHTSKPLQDVFTTLENISPPRKPRVVNVTETSITVNWRAKSDTLSGFLISVVPSSTAPSVEKTLSPDARQFTIADLLPGIHYTISIYAVSGNTRSQPATVTATTALRSLDAPKDLRFDSASQDSITFSWQPPRAPIMSYVVTYSSEVGSLNRLTPAPGPRDTSATITNLQPSTRYTIGIYAVQNSMRSAQLTGKHRTEQELQLPQLATRPPNFPARYIPPFLDIPTSSQHSSTVLERDPNSESRSTRYYTRQRSLNNRQNGRPLSGQRPVGDFLTALTPSHSPDRSAAGFTPSEVVFMDRGLVPIKTEDRILGPQEAAKTLTTISWSPQPQASEYLLSCYPLSGEGETTQIRVPAGTSSATLAGLADGTQYSVVVEALQGTQRYRVHEEVVTARAVSSPHEGVESDEDLCLDTATSIYYSVGQEWERLSENGFMLYCRCLGFGNGHYRCDSSRWCHDNGKNYREGETWDRPADNGQMLTCTCLGRGKGEYKCEPHEASCYDEGKMYQAGDQWRKLYRGAMCTCTCLGGQQGWRCEECRSPSEEDAGSSHTAAASHSSSASQGVFSQYIQSVRRSAGTNCAFNCR